MKAACDSFTTHSLS